MSQPLVTLTGLLCKQDQAEEVLIGLVNLIKIVVEQHGAGAVSSALQEAAQHLHDQGILVSSM